MSKLLFLIFLCLLNANVQALKCYVCSTSPDDIDQRCVTSPETVKGGIHNCNKNYCTSVRIEYIDPKDKIQTMARGCEDNPLFINQVLEDSTYRSYFKACQTDLCNSGSGKGFSGNGGLGMDMGEEIMLLVPGIGFDNDGALARSCNLFLIIVIAIAVLLYN